MKRIVISMAAAAMLLLAACQTTPETAAVIGKDGQTLEEKASQNSGSGTPEAPENYQEQFEGSAYSQYGDRYLKINYDAKVEVPAADSVAVKVVVPSNFDDNEVSNAVRILSEGNSVFYAKPDDVLTKKDIERSINEDKKYLKGMEEANPEEYSQCIGEYTEEFKARYTQMESLPDDYDYKEWDGTVGDELYLEWNLDKPQADDADLINYAAGKENGLWIGLDSGRTHTIVAEQTQANGKSMTPEEAKAAVEALLNELGVENMELSVMVNHAEMDDSDYYQLNLTEVEDLDSHYCLYYVPSVNGMKLTHTEWKPSERESENYAEAWEDERIKICIDENGVIRYDHLYPMEIKEELGGNVELMSFEDAVTSFESNIQRTDRFSDNEYLEGYELNIDRITLGYAKVRRENSNDEYLLVPAWDFFGSVTEVYRPGEGKKFDSNIEGDRSEEGRVYAHSYLTINAVDGSVISRVLGY